MLEQSFCLNFKTTNNIAEYEALIAALRLAKAVGAENLKAHCDPQLVASQFSGYFEAKTREWMHTFTWFKIKPRNLQLSNSSKFPKMKIDRQTHSYHSQ